MMTCNDFAPRLPPARAPSSTIRNRFSALTKALKTAAFIGFIAVMRLGPGRLLWAWVERRIARGETIWLDRWGLLPPDQAEGPPDAPKTDFAPRREVRPRKSRLMKLARYPEPRYPFAYKRKPLSGNVINGVGESTSRRVGKVFHSGNYRVPLGGLERWFHMRAPISAFLAVMRIRWETRLRTGPVAPSRWQPVDADDAAQRIKSTARALGADLVGITSLRDEDRFADFDEEYATVVVVATTMRREDMLYAPSERSCNAVQDGYRAVALVAMNLAAQLRALGWQAKASTNLGADTAEVLHIPLAVRAGLGQLGKHGSLITLAHGSNVRLATVLTNLPATKDSPQDIGVDDFCTHCQVCTTNCPPQAILDDKVLVRGQHKWYVDFDKCIPYFAEHQGCGICIEVCPWSEAGRGSLISTKALARRNSHNSKSANSKLKASPPVAKAG